MHASGSTFILRKKVGSYTDSLCKIKSFYLETANYSLKVKCKQMMHDVTCKPFSFTLQSLEIATAKLRTQFYFCPTERCLEKAKRKYISSLQVQFIQKGTTKTDENNNTFLLFQNLERTFILQISCKVKCKPNKSALFLKNCDFYSSKFNFFFKLIQHLSTKKAYSNIDPFPFY